MDDKRYIELESNPDSKLTEEEIEAGWHWCPDWDYMLINPEMDESECCLCDNYHEKHKI